MVTCTINMSGQEQPSVYRGMLLSRQSSCLWFFHNDDDDDDEEEDEDNEKSCRGIVWSPHS